MPAPAFADASAVEELVTNGTSTTGALAAALGEVRRYCQWHVAPLWEHHTVTLTGRGPSLILPTLNVVTLEEIVENDVIVDLARVDSDAGILEHRDGRPWSPRRGGITVTMTHGYTLDEVPELVGLILDVAAGAHLAPVGLSNGAEKIGPFEYGGASGVTFTPAHYSVLDAFRLPVLP
ncbi:head-to-tail adaptor [Gordonia phage Jojo24]|uniref:Head-to-tail adaptor n=1 Tax=Gordonia phage Jojo24 TaxID=2859476 RepID=A0AAE7VH77_9CAUD|nr:head-to-tail adaptor [Gordonia phage Jojo24]QXO13105.1 head-to-tail adaptor [Gordonia phage Jojo24]